MQTIQTITARSGRRGLPVAKEMSPLKTVASAQTLAYNDIEAESLLRNRKRAMHSTKGGMPD